MRKKINSVLIKTAKIAGVTCITAGAIAIMTSSTALKAIGEGGKYLANTVKKIVSEPEVLDCSAGAAEEALAEADDAPASEEI